MQITTATAQGRREYQEDRFWVHEFPYGVVAAIMDGHGGDEVSQKVADLLPQFWSEYIQPEDVPATLEEICAALNVMTQYMDSGSTLSLAFITPERAHIAVLGDSPVLALDSTGTVFVGPIHNARSNPAERLAAQARGAFFDGNYIFARFSGGGLQMTRVLGDVELRRVLNRKPEIVSVDLTPNSFVLVASDGLLDPSHKKTGEEVAAVVDLIEKGADAQALVDRAVALPTNDNVTAILVRL